MTAALFAEHDGSTVRAFDDSGKENTIAESSCALGEVCLKRVDGKLLAIADFPIYRMFASEKGKGFVESGASGAPEIQSPDARHVATVDKDSDGALLLNVAQVSAGEKFQQIVTKLDSSGTDIAYVYSLTWSEDSKSVLLGCLTDRAYDTTSEGDNQETIVIEFDLKTRKLTVVGNGYVGFKLADGRYFISSHAKDAGFTWESHAFVGKFPTAARIVVAGKAKEAVAGITLLDYDQVGNRFLGFRLTKNEESSPEFVVLDSELKVLKETKIRATGQYWIDYDRLYGRAVFAP